MVKLSYEQMRRLAELGDDGGKLTVKNRQGKVLRPALKQWKAPPPLGHSSFFGRTEAHPAPVLRCSSVAINGSSDQGLRRCVGKGRM